MTTLTCFSDCIQPKLHCHCSPHGQDSLVLKTNDILVGVYLHSIQLDCGGGVSDLQFISPSSVTLFCIVFVTHHLRDCMREKRGLLLYVCLQPGWRPVICGLWFGYIEVPQSPAYFQRLSCNCVLFLGKVIVL